MLDKPPTDPLLEMIGRYNAALKAAFAKETLPQTRFPETQPYNPSTDYQSPRLLIADHHPPCTSIAGAIAAIDLTLNDDEFFDKHEWKICTNWRMLHNALQAARDYLAALSLEVRS